MSGDGTAQFLVQAPRRRVLVVGDVMLDRYINGNVTRVSPEDSTCLVLNHEPPVERKLGGAANVACNLVALGATVDLIGLGGDRKFKDKFHSTLKAATEGLEGTLRCHLTNGARKFTVKTRYCAHGRQLLRVDYEDVRPPASEELAELKELYEQTAGEFVSEGAPDIAILSDYGKGVVLDDEAVAPLGGSSNFLSWLLQQLKRDHVKYVVDPKRSDIEAYGHALAICPNQHEWRQVCSTGHKPLAKHVIVTSGERGCTIMPWDEGHRLADGCCHEFPVEPVEVADTTGAGDTFIATLGLALACHVSIDAACGIANTAARKVVSREGTAIISLNELGKEFR